MKVTLPQLEREARRATGTLYVGIREQGVSRFFWQVTVAIQYRGQAYQVARLAPTRMGARKALLEHLRTMEPPPAEAAP